METKIPFETKNHALIGTAAIDLFRKTILIPLASKLN